MISNDLLILNPWIFSFSVTSIFVFLGWEDRSGHHPAPEKGAERRAGALETITGLVPLGKSTGMQEFFPPILRVSEIGQVEVIQPSKT